MSRPRRDQRVVGRRGAEDWRAPVGSGREVILVGRKPRPAHEGLLWHRAPTLTPERQLLSLRHSGRGLTVLSVSRRVCQWRNGRSRGYYVLATTLFAHDGVHLIGTNGYRRRPQPYPVCCEM